MFRDNRYINAGENEIYKFGHKSREFAASFLDSHNGYISIPVATKHWTFGTSNGKYGEFCKLKGTCFSVNDGGFAYAKIGSEKCEILCQFIQSVIDEMKRLDAERIEHVREIRGIEDDE